MPTRTYIFLCTLLLLFACSNGPDPGAQREVKVGAQVLLEKHLDELLNKNVGLVMNPTARVGNRHMLDTLLARDVNVVSLFAPEHGFKGEAGAGETIENGIHQETGLPIHSLYGETRKPTAEMLQNIDILLFDMQDVGARFYTYNVTLGLVLEAAAENGVALWVLDRPNPAGGNYVSGWILRDEYRSFVGAYPIPMAHGMTLGELAKMMVGEDWLEVSDSTDLRVIPIEGWKRSMKWPETGLDWYPPSPNLPTFEHAFSYLGTVLFEGTNLSEGRGTDDPFLTIGSPDTRLADLEVQELAQKFNGVTLDTVSFVPRSIPGKAVNPKHRGQECHGVRIHITDYEAFDPVEFGVALLDLMLKATEEGQMNDFIFKLAGSDQVKTLNAEAWQESIEAFREARKPYLLY